jgi:toxin ParE1/3/4
VKPIIFHRAARRELDEAIAEYEFRRPSLGIELLAAVQAAQTRIQQHPKIGSRYKKTKFRKFVLPRFPYNVFYLELNDCLWIAALAHQKRKPDYWITRSPEE